MRRFESFLPHHIEITGEIAISPAIFFKPVRTRTRFWFRCHVWRKVAAALAQVLQNEDMDSNKDSGSPWRVRGLFSQTGVTSAIEQTQLNATPLAIREINSAGCIQGRIIEPVITHPPPVPKQI